MATVKELFASATTDEQLGVSTVDLDAIIRREQRGATRRHAVVGLFAIMLITAATVTAPSLLDTQNGSAPVPTAPSPTLTPTPTQIPTPTPTAPPTYQQLNRLAGDALLQHFPDTQRFIPTSQIPATTGVIMGETHKGVSPNGPGVSVVGMAMFWDPAVDSPDADPCVLKPGQTAGRQGAPRTDDVCTSVPQPDGSRVWLRRTHQMFLPGQTEMTIVMASQLRPNQLYVTVDVNYWDPTTAPYDESAIIAAVTDPRLTALPLGSRVIFGAID